jgi:hypothetical protein
MSPFSVALGLNMRSQIIAHIVHPFLPHNHVKGANVEIAASNTKSSDAL